MFNSKYSNVLTVILIIVIIAIIALIGFLGFDYFRKVSIDKDAQDYISEYENQMQGIIAQNPSNNTVEDGNSVPTVIEPIENGNAGNNGNGTGSSTTSKFPKYKGFDVLGYIEIPKTGIGYPVLSKVTPKSLETSVAYYYGPGLNEVGNTTIVGHNYRNGAFFGKNKRLKVGDAIYIKDNTGRRIKYTIYKTYTTTETDAEYITRDTNGAREISLSTCTDDSKGRLIILARE